MGAVSSLIVLFSRRRTYMGIVIRQSMKASFAAYIGVAVGMTNVLLVSTQFLSPEQLGLSRLLLENSLIFAGMANLGVPFMADRFFARYRDDARGHHGILLFMLLFPLLGIGLFVLLYWLFQNQILAYFGTKSPLILGFHYLVLPLTVLWVYVSVLEAYCRNNARIAVPTFVREVYIKAANMVLVLLFGLGWYSFEWMMYLIVASYALAVGALLIYIRILGKLYLNFDFKILRTKYFQEILGSGLFVIVSGLGSNLILLIDRTILSGESKNGLTDMAIFTIAMLIASIIEIPRNMVRQISGPIIALAIHQKDWQRVGVMYQKSALNLLLVAGIAFVLMWCNIDSIFSVLPKAEIYKNGKLVVLLLGLAKVIEMANGLNAEIIQYSQHYRKGTYLVFLIAFVAVWLNKWLVPQYQYNGAALATTLSVLIYCAGRVGLVWYWFRLQPYTFQALKAVAVLAVIFGIGLVLPPLGASVAATVATVAYKSLVLAGVFGGAVVYFDISEDVTAMWHGLKAKR